MKRLLIILCLLFNALPSFCQEIWVNDLRSLFLNNRAIIYVINIRTFNAKDTNLNDLIEKDKGEESGTFINAIDRLDALSAIGINTIHILPITEIGKMKALGTAGSLYAIKSFDKLNPQFDDPNNSYSVEQEAKLFISEAHRRGIRVIVDLPSCGSYDLALSQPNLFVKKADGSAVTPSDWTDVRLFRVQNDDGSLNQELMQNYKKFVDLMIKLNVDGIRADVAAIKPYKFWKELIDYTRAKSPQFLYLAEASDSWSNPVVGYANYESVENLLEAGFDGWYGEFFNIMDYKNSNELIKALEKREKFLKKYNYQKSTIAAFATHDTLSPILYGGERYSDMLIWLNVTLPLNPYFVDGFISGDSYTYKYANKRADKTYTDDDYYFVHKGKIDIFNFSRRPGGNDENLINSFKVAMRFKNWADPLLASGKFVPLKTNNENVFAFARSLSNDSVVVVLNRDSKNTVDANVSINSLKASSFMVPVKTGFAPEVKNGKIHFKLMPYEIQVIMLSKVKI